ncbi:two-component system histidine kinase PnpS [Liquorilactobacillus oeni]|uniref:histidine kinase n=1 Tax=Liquorilactobacillus oeni DSM 19972 TaxID=1423777 RepID=A0A0R1MHR4_9LACO|nr:ATP-binding protein [Liquorilactobacillus oeni]KRL04837.1 two component sensor transduction histidine kinase [Liquorilactobacillus oeni DSM 19972]
MKRIRIIRTFFSDAIIIFIFLTVIFLLVIRQVRNGSVSAWGVETFLLLSVTAIILAAVDIFGRYLRFRKRKQNLEALNSRLSNIIEGTKGKHVLLEPSDPYYELSQSINAVQSMKDMISKSFVTQQRGYFSLIEYLTIGVMVLDQDRKIYLSNHAMSDLIGREMNLKKQLYVNVLRTYELSQLIERVYQDRQDQHAEIKLDFSDKVVDAHVVYVPVSEHHFLVMALLYDITELKEIERMQMDFVGNVSHELKTPITAITGFSETLLQGALKDPKALKEFLNIIHQESLKLTELVEDILSLARIDASPELKLDEIDIRKFIINLLRPFRPEISKKDIHVEIQIPNGCTVQVDQNKLRHVINNLVQNAIKYNNYKGNVWLKGTIKKDSWFISVNDNGYGIPKDEKERIFERFYRVDTSRSRQNGGTGLGLSVVKEYVEAMSGKITVDSQVGVGSTFTVIFPLELPTAPLNESTK